MNRFDLSWGDKHWIGFGGADPILFEHQDGMVTDSKAGLIKRLPNGEMVVLALHGGSYLRVQGKEMC